MRLRELAADVVVRAPAKVNLFLEVLGKRTDGYHEIATLMAAVRLFDTLVFKEEPPGTLLLACQHPDLSTAHDNLILQAARLLQQRTGCIQGASIRLIKRIPLAAGLAGGSTDAAATLAGLNRLWRLGLSVTQLAQLGAELGSDVPFFMGGPTAWCTGRGEKIEPVRLGRPLDLVLVCPAFGLSTKAVYENLVVPQKPLAGDELRRAVEQGDVTMIGRRLHNRLQEAAEKLEPRIRAYYRRLADLAPAGQLMSGSGSSLFALCSDRVQAQRLAAQLRPEMDKERLEVHLVRSCSAQPRLGGPSG
jgi:4-diphosphocytidyl-2-C-methyl-D-erythritol kinase